MEKTDKIKLLTVREAAEMIDGLSEYRIRKLVKEGVIPSFMSGNKILMSKDALVSVVLGNTVSIAENQE